MLSIDWANSVNHVKGGQFTAGSDDGFPSRQPLRKPSATNLATLFENLRPSSAMNRTVNSPATDQRRVCRINDRVEVLFSDIAHNDAHATIKKIGCALSVDER